MTRATTRPLYSSRNKTMNWKKKRKRRTRSILLGGDHSMQESHLDVFIFLRRIRDLYFSKTTRRWAILRNIYGRLSNARIEGIEYRITKESSDGSCVTFVNDTWYPFSFNTENERCEWTRGKKSFKSIILRLYYVICIICERDNYKPIWWTNIVTHIYNVTAE